MDPNSLPVSKEQIAALLAVRTSLRAQLRQLRAADLPLPNE
ncbi:MAG: hypothetical protein JWN15_4226 [Firmicutes bacterium]|jgi:hypothetical protein|nr:hypothetical protein [Bacillota bacterium]